MYGVPDFLLPAQAYINGLWCDADEGKVFSVSNPANGEVLAHVPAMGGAETERALQAAEQAWRAWREYSANERAQVLLRWHEQILQHEEALAHLITAECGKPLAEARGEVHYGAAFVEWFAEEAKRAYGEIIPTLVRDQRLLVLKQSIGVCAAITPWNFPLAMVSRKVAPALAAGCTVVLKPDEQTPLTALALAQLAQLAGVPAGVFNVLTGPAAEIGAVLCASPIVRKLSFTGSTAVGRLLMQQCAPTVKKLSLELGGNAPFIVFDDADLDAALDGAMLNKYRNSGQTCVCANRFLIHDTVYDQFAANLAARVANLRVGPGINPDTHLGPLINADALEKVSAYVAEALQAGAKLITGGHRIAGPGCFFQATLLTEVRAEMRIAQEEVFGPVACLLRFKDEAEAIRLANQTPYGLAAYCYTRDLGRSFRLAESLEYGMVGLNTGLISNAVSPFGGIKQSGIGREGSRHGLDEYLEMKYVCLGLGSSA